MELCYRGIHYSAMSSNQAAQSCCRTVLPINLNYRGRQYTQSFQSFNGSLFNTSELERSALRRMLVAKQRYQLIYRGIAYALAF